MIDALLIVGMLYLLVRDYQVKKTLSSEIFIDLAKGNKRLWRGYWKVNPNDYEKIAVDQRTHEKIGEEYKISRSRVGQIKRDYYKQREIECKEIVSKYFRKLPFDDSHKMDA